MEENKTIDDFYPFKIGNMWAYFKSQHFSFWMLSCYLFVEFVRPQSLFPSLDFLPWAQLFLVGSMVGAFIDPTVKWVSSFSNVLICGFLLAIIVSILFAEYPEVSQDHFMYFFGWFIIYFLIINIVNTKERFYIFLLIFLLAAGKIAFGTSKSWIARGFSFTPWGLMGPKGYFQNSGELAILMLMLFPLGFYLFSCLRKNASKLEILVLVVLWVCPILTILGASSRGAQVALLFQLLIMFRKSLFKWKSLVGIVLLVVSIVYLLPQEQKDRFSSAGDDKTSQQRLLYWENGWEMMKDYPFTGVGFFNFIPHYERYYSSDMLYPTAQLPHNIFIQVGTDAGFFALGIFIVLLLYSLFVSRAIALSYKNSPIERGIAAGLGFGVLGFIIAGQFVTVTYYPFFWIHLAFIVCLAKITEMSRGA